MNILNINNKSVYFYLALEEYLIKNTTDDYFFLWNTDNCVVCGKHQNIYEEINLPFVIENKIKLARRISGGGTIFQDKGNLNFTFILNKESGKQIDFKKHIEPIYQYLKTLNIDVSYSKRNDLFINGEKISGNAEHVYKNRVLHHGTLLFNSDLYCLDEAIKTKDRYISKSVKSVRKKVTNIKDYTNNLDFNEFKTGLYNYIKKYFNTYSDYVLNKDDVKNVNILVDNKYSTHFWIYNYTSKFKYEGTIKTKLLVIKFELKIEKGIIVNCNFYDYDNINSLFLGKEYNVETISLIISNNKLNELFKIDFNTLLYSFF